MIREIDLEEEPIPTPLPEEVEIGEAISVALASQILGKEQGVVGYRTEGGSLAFLCRLTPRNNRVSYGFIYLNMPKTPPSFITGSVASSLTAAVNAAGDYRRSKRRGGGKKRMVLIADDISELIVGSAALAKGGGGQS